MFLLLKLLVEIWSSLNWNLFKFPRYTSSWCRSETVNIKIISIWEHTILEFKLVAFDAQEHYYITKLISFKVFNGKVPLTSKNACWLCLCLHQITPPKPITMRQRHPKLKPKAIAILWDFGLPDCKASREAKILLSAS